MVALTVILAFFLVLLMYVLFIPFAFEIDTQSGIFRVAVKYTGYAGLTVSDEGNVFFEFRILFWGKKIEIEKLITNRKTEKRKKEAENTKGKKRTKRIKDLPKRILAVIKSFKVRECYINIDTGDYLWNGWLYPPAWFISKKSGWQVSTNFSGHNDVKLFVENNVFKMLRAFITKR